MYRTILCIILAFGLQSCGEPGKDFASCSEAAITCISATADRLNMLEPYTVELSFTSKDSRYAQEDVVLELRLAGDLKEAMRVEWLNPKSATIEFDLKNGSTAFYKLDHLENKFHFRINR